MFILEKKEEEIYKLIELAELIYENNFYGNIKVLGYYGLNYDNYFLIYKNNKLVKTLYTYRDENNIGAKFQKELNQYILDNGVTLASSLEQVYDFLEIDINLDLVDYIIKSYDIDYRYDALGDGIHILSNKNERFVLWDIEGFLISTKKEEIVKIFNEKVKECEDDILSFKKEEEKNC